MFPLITMLAATNLPPALPADGKYQYKALLAGAPAGSSTITLSRNSSGAQVTESAAGNYGGATYGGNATLTLNAALIPTNYSAVYTPPGQSIHAAVSFSGNTAAETSDNGNQTFALMASTQHFAILDGSLFAGFFILPAELRAWGTQSFTVVAPMFGRSAAISTDASLKPDRPSGLPAGDVALSVSEPVEFTIWYDPATLIVDELDVPRQSASFIRIR